jgi:hypothetical protein
LGIRFSQSCFGPPVLLAWISSIPDHYAFPGKAELLQLIFPGNVCIICPQENADLKKYAMKAAKSFDILVQQG